jgi:serine/threonine protein kinase
MDNVTLALPVGFQLDQLRIESVLGKGGFGITYVATDLRLNKKVALKELLPDSIVTRVEGNTVVPHSQSSMEGWEWARERFLDEATRLASFSHPAIVGVHHFLEANACCLKSFDTLGGWQAEAGQGR